MQSAAPRLTHNPPVVGSSPTHPTTTTRPTTTSELGLCLSWRACSCSGIGGRWPGHGRIPLGADWVSVMEGGKWLSQRAGGHAA